MVGQHFDVPVKAQFQRKCVPVHGHSALFHALISAYTASLELVPLGRNGRWSGWKARRILRLLKNHSRRSGAQADQSTLNTSLLAPVTFRATSAGKRLQTAATHVMQCTRARNGFVVSSAASTEVASSGGMDLSSTMSLATSSSAFSGLETLPVKNEPHWLWLTI